MDFSAIFQLKSMWDAFKYNHPKFPQFIQNLASRQFETGQEIAIAVRYPDGTEFKTGIRVTEEDLALLNNLKNLAASQNPYGR